MKTEDHTEQRAPDLFELLRRDAEILHRQVNAGEITLEIYKELSKLMNAYLHPESRMTDGEFVDQALGILDDVETVRKLRELGVEI